MHSAKSKLKKNKKKAFRVRNGLLSRGEKFRISVFKSIRYIYAQIIDDANHKTVASFSSLNLAKESSVKKDKKAIAKQVGLSLGEKAKQLGIENVFFDRGRFSYHGRVAILADGLRESGLKF